MKNHRLIVPLLALALAALAPGAETRAAAKPPQENTPEWAGLFGGAPLPVVWQSARAAAAKIAAASGERSFAGVPDWAETIHLAAHALLDQAKLGDAERQKRLDGVLRQAAKLADEVLDAARHQEREKLDESFRRLNAALALAASRLPAEIVSAAPAPVRFATSPAQPAEEKPKPAKK